MGADFISLVNISRIILRFRPVTFKASLSPSEVLYAALKNIKAKYKDRSRKTIYLCTGPVIELLWLLKPLVSRSTVLHGNTDSIE